MKKLFAWGNKNAASIYTGCVVVALMTGLIIVQDMRYTAKEVIHLREKGDLINVIEDKEVIHLREKGDLINVIEEIQLARAEEHKIIDFQSEIVRDLRKTNEKKDLYIMRANEVVNTLSGELSYAQAIITTLREYLMKLGEWPPKVAPPSRPKPINPNDLAKGRNEA